MVVRTPWRSFVGLTLALEDGRIVSVADALDDARAARGIAVRHAVLRAGTRLRRRPAAPAAVSADRPAIVGSRPDDRAAAHPDDGLHIAASQLADVADPATGRSIAA